MAHWALPLIVTVLFIGANSLSDEEEKKKIKVFDDCKKENGLSQDDIQELFDMKGVKTLSGHPCFVKCVMQKYDMIEDTGKISPEKSKPIQEAVWPDKSALPRLFEATQNCMKDTPVDSDTCVYVYNQALCVFDFVIE